MGDIDRDDLKKVLGALSKKSALNDGDIIEVAKKAMKTNQVAISVIDEGACNQCGLPTPRKLKNADAAYDNTRAC